MSNVLVLYYSSWGHVEKMAMAAAEGARSTGAVASVKRVPETVPADVAKLYHYKLDQAAPLATPDELASYDGIIFGTPTRYGMMASQMKTFLDQTGSLWQSGRLIGKVGAAFSASGTQHGGQEATLLSFHTVLLHLGFVVAGLPYSFQGQMGVEKVDGGTPYGASTIAASDGSRWPSEIELQGARFQGAHVARLATRLAS